ncbi:uncharacterized protein LOC108478983 [Gossypium arboreum]|uniref:Uncharacterized protein n=1 Tax=Gossypium arboreum TaxID=29729 RepID=A0ABR0QJW9_GOSAR|nr:uncharacterized protein LOC108478983 [Gossypium arboreum]KAK5839314.1 hypothetical protein PVK06_008090 [Gossypium arboreum]
MAESGSEFPGFQICVHKEELVFRRPLSRLQRQAPRPLQIKPNADGKASPSQAMDFNLKSSSSSSVAVAATSSTSFSSFYQSKDPIPLLSPLVLPTLLQSSYLHQEGNTAP